MAYLLNIPTYKCRCGRLATRRLFNRTNDLLAYYCKACGNRELDRLNRQEAEAAVRLRLNEKPRRTLEALDNEKPDPRR